MYVYMHGSCSATVCQSQHEVKSITVCQAFIMNSDERREARLRRRRERRATESSEERETRLAKRRVADRATVLSTKRVEWVVFQSFDIFSVMVHAIETKKHTNMIPKDY